jgi:cation diffusion facilitator CzcD-associated flavoprotein CzcO
MELNVWTSTTIEGQPTFDPKTHEWTITLNRNGTTRIFHPRHIILASGATGEPRVPQFKGEKNFKGDIHHSSKHAGGAAYKGKRAVIIGCCNSGHDIARDLYENGATSVTMVQRSSTYVMTQDNGLRILMGGTYSEGGLPTEDADLFAQCLPIPIFKVIQQHLTKQVAAADNEILSSLEKAGFKLDYGYDGSGLMIKFFLLGGGYYIDVGCSKLIGDGHIKIKQGVEVEEIVSDGIVFQDGSKLEADVVVLATGYVNMRETARKVFGDGVGDKVRDVWGLNEEGEIATIWQSITPLISAIIDGRIWTGRLLVHGWELGTSAVLFEIPGASDQSD